MGHVSRRPHTGLSIGAFLILAVFIGIIVCCCKFFCCRKKQRVVECSPPVPGFAYPAPYPSTYGTHPYPGVAPGYGEPPLNYGTPMTNNSDQTSVYISPDQAVPSTTPDLTTPQKHTNLNV